MLTVLLPHWFHLDIRRTAPVVDALAAVVLGFLPAVAAQLINILYNLVDKMFIGRIPEVGKQALAGVGVPRR